MADLSGISWTKSTFNPWMGCQRVSEGCTNCYAESLVTNRMGYSGKPGSKQLLWGPKADRQRTSIANWKKPISWNAEAGRTGEFWPVFCSSLADVFEDRDELHPWRMDLWKLIQHTPSLTWLLLTKRPERVLECVPRHWLEVGHGPGDVTVNQWPANVWIGTTTESQKRLDERLPHLLAIPAHVRFLSVEPQLEPVRLGLPGLGIQWAITGGESGPQARWYDPEWAASLIREGREFGFAPFVKQMGEKWARTVHARQVHGADPAEWPAALRVQEFPFGLTTARLAAKQALLPIVGQP